MTLVLRRVVYFVLDELQRRCLLGDPREPLAEDEVEDLYASIIAEAEAAFQEERP